MYGIISYSQDHTLRWVLWSVRLDVGNSWVGVIECGGVLR